MFFRTFSMIGPLLSLGICAQTPPSILWEDSFGGSASDQNYGIDLTDDGGLLVAGHASSVNGDVSGNVGLQDYWVFKLDGNGALLWENSLGGTVNDVARSIEQTSDGGSVVFGYTASNNGDVTGHHGGNDYWVVKLDMNGDLVWQNALGGSGNDFLIHGRQTSDGGYIACGNSESTDGDVTGNNGGRDLWLVRLDASGTLQWQLALGGSGDDFGLSVSEAQDGGFLVAGSTGSNDGDVSSNNGMTDLWVLKVDSAGNLQWEHALGGSDNDYGVSLAATADGGAVVCGHTGSTDGDVGTNQGMNDLWVLKVDASGALQWETTHGGSLDDYASEVIPTSDGGYAVMASSDSDDGDVGSNNGDRDAWLVQLDDQGALIWSLVLGGSALDRGSALRQTADDGFVLSASSASNDGDVSGNNGNNDHWVVRLTGGPASIPERGPSILTIGPNPTTGTFTIRMGTHTRGDRVRVMDSIGRTVIERTGPVFPLTMDLGNERPGRYLVEVQLEGRRTVRPLIVE